MTKILWIEDEINTVEPLTRLLQDKNTEVLKARSKKEALEILNSEYDLILVDLILPQEIDEPFEHFVGLSIVRYIIKNNIKTPLVVYSIVKEPMIENELAAYRIPFFYKGNTDIVEFSEELINMIEKK
jgi:CheY-like chemotaxis protein